MSVSHSEVLTNCFFSRLEEEKAEILREYNRLPKQEDVEQHIKNLTRQAEELQDEISMV